MIKIKYENGPVPEQVIKSEDGKITFGRSKDNLVCLSNNKVSRNHCVLVLEQHRFVLKDLDTINGTFVNGKSISTQEVEPGDKIRVGDFIFTFFPVQEAKNADPFDEPDPDVFKKMRQNKGYETIFAETIGEAKKRDYLNIIENKPANVDTAYYLKKSFKNLGYTSVEADNLIKEASGTNAESFPTHLVKEVQSPKYNELVIVTRDHIPDIQVAQLVRYKDKDYLVLDITCNENYTTTYRLKMC